MPWASSRASSHVVCIACRKERIPRTRIHSYGHCLNSLRTPHIKKSATEFCRFQIINELRPRPRSEEIGALDALGCDFQGEIDVSDVGPAEIGTLMSRGSRKSTLA